MSTLGHGEQTICPIRWLRICQLALRTEVTRGYKLVVSLLSWLGRLYISHQVSTYVSLDESTKDGCRKSQNLVLCFTTEDKMLA